MTKILVVSAGLSQPSSTRLLADRLAAATRTAFGDELVLETVEVRDYAHDITDHLLTGFANTRLRPLLEKIASADGLVLVTPTFTASYSGLFKSLLDVVEPDSLRDTPVLIGATGGTERHSLMLEHALRPVLAYLKAVVVPTAVYAANGDWGTDPDLNERITQAATELADEIARRPAQVDSDPFLDPVPFAELLDSAES